VFQNNIMPANAAAWYMAKRKFYANQPLDQQLLAFLLKKYPDKFRLNKFKVGYKLRSIVAPVLCIRIGSDPHPSSGFGSESASRAC
jgi:hypothetical protein